MNVIHSLFCCFLIDSVAENLGAIRKIQIKFQSMCGVIILYNPSLEITIYSTGVGTLVHWFKHF